MAQVGVQEPGCCRAQVQAATTVQQELQLQQPMLLQGQQSHHHWIQPCRQIAIWGPGAALRAMALGPWPAQ